MTSDVTGNNTVKKRSSSAGNGTAKKSVTGRKNHTAGSRGKKNQSSKGKNGKNDTINTGSKTKKNHPPQEGEQKILEDEIRFLVAVGITILLTMCNFHLCMSVGDGIYYILHGLFGWLAYILPFVLLWGYLFMIPNRGSTEAKTKTKLSLLLFVEFCCLFHFAGIKESQPFSPTAYFTAGQSGINGGLVGGLFSGILQHLIGTVATILIIFLLMLITVILLTERSAVRTMQSFAASLQTLGGKNFQRIREMVQEWFYAEDEYEDDYEEEYDGEESPEDWKEPETSDQSVESGENRTEEKYSGRNEKSRSFSWEFKTSGSGRKHSEFFTQKFPFMNDGNQKTEKEKKKEQGGSRRNDRADGAEPAAEFSDENWRRGFSSSAAGGSQSSGNSSGTRPGYAKAGSIHAASAEGRPGSSSARITLERDSRSLAEMGFEKLLQEEEPQVTGSIDDFIIYNGMMQTAKMNETREYGDDAAADQAGEEAGFHGKYEAGEEAGFHGKYEAGEEAGSHGGYEAGEEAGSHGGYEEETGDRTDACDQAGLKVQTGLENQGVDITEHVILPEDGPIIRSALDSQSHNQNPGQVPVPAGHGGTGAAGSNPSAAGAGKGSGLAGNGNSIWKQSSGPGNRESSGAVTFSSKPKPQEKKHVVKKPYGFPPANLLKRNTAFSGGLTRTHREIQQKLYETLQSFGVKVNMGMISVGPAVTRYELEPEPGVKVSRIVALQDDIKLALAASDIRIEAPIPGKSAIGIEVPNQENTVVGFRELIEAETFQKHPSRVAVAVGRDISGQIIVADLAKMPHLLIAGATGSGKSVCINTLIMSIIYKATPDEVKLVMVDPKVVELSIYNGIPHLLVPVVTDARKAANALRWAVDEMNDRYKKFAEYNVRNIEGYNEFLKKEKARDPSNEEPYLYQMVIIVDELADLMMVAQSEVEEAICRLAQMARAAGIHLVLATQRPSVNVITGLIKANVPSRIAFAVSSGVDSRTIIDMNGAEKLLGKGDMLFYPYGLPKPIRVQGAFISDEEVSRVVTWLHKNNGEISGQEMMEKMITSASENAAVRTERDEYFESAARFIIEKDKASIGALQRNFKIGFNRAARLMDQLADAGVVGEEDGTKPRKILMSMDEFNQFIEAD